MKKFVIKDDFWEIFPECKIGIVVCKGISNVYHDNEAAFEARIREAEQKAAAYLTEETFSDNSVIRIWREAYQKFKTKKGARSSIEALMKRISKENHLGAINPLVDIYNIVSLMYAMPCGGEDIDKMEGDLLLTKACGDESFRVIGSDSDEPPYPGEIVYKDDGGAVCRCWNWREAERTMLTENTVNAMLCCELGDPKRDGDFLKALAVLKAETEKYLGGQCEIKILDIQNREADLL